MTDASFELCAVFIINESIKTFFVPLRRKLALLPQS